MGRRKRIIYQSQAVEITSPYLSGSLNGSGLGVVGVQSASYGIDVAREDANQYGNLGAFDRVILEAPTSNGEFSFNLGGIGRFNLSGILDDAVKGSGVTPRFILDPTEGSDFDDANTNNVVELVNSKLTSLSAEGSVGAVATCTLGFEGTDLQYKTNADAKYKYGYGETDSDQYDTISGMSNGLTAVTADQITVSLGSATAGSTQQHLITSGHAQSASVSFDLGTEGLQALGLSGTNKFQYARVPSYPATATLSVESLAIDKGMSLQLSNLEQKASDGSAESDGGFQDVSVTFGSNANTHTKFALDNCTLDSLNFTSSIGDNATVDATFGVSIGGANSTSKLRIGK